ncbi:MAG: site-specific integrase [Hyphomonadaceae bacterium]|nr:site-specific integrase [Hyphomonadaceae bacterium]
MTDALARKAKPKCREYALADVALQGFALRVQPSGSKAWILRMRVEGKLRRFTIGSPNTMNADEARTRAFQLRTEHQPKTVIQLACADEPAITFRELSHCLLQAKAGVWKPSTIKAVTTYLNAELLPTFGDRPINRLTTAEIAAWFNAYSARRPGGANQALTHLRTALKFARETGRLPRDAPDPSSPIRKNTRRARGRLLNANQLAKLGAWLEAPQLRWLDVADAIHLILLTGCRSGEISRLQWAEVLEDRLRLKASKTGSRDVVLTPPAIAILVRRRKGTRSLYVFPASHDPGKPIGTLDVPWRSIRERIGLPREIRLHDLRHTYASQAIMTGETLSMAGQLLGHRSPQTTEIYAHLDARHLADTADRVSQSIHECLESGCEAAV